MDPSGWDRLGKGVDFPKNHTSQEGVLGDLDVTSSVTSAGMVKFGEVIEKSCSDALVHTPEVCKGIASDHHVPGYQG
jgi:hypothetical protein